MHCLRLKYLVLMIPFLMVKPVFASGPDHVLHQFILMLKQNTDAITFCTDMTDELGVEVKLVKLLSPSLNIVLIEYGSEVSEEKAMRRLIRKSEVKLIQFNHTNLEIRDAPNDSLYSRQWAFNNDGVNGGTGLSDISAEDAWDITTGGLSPAGDSIVVAVIDQGFQVNHPDLVDNLFVNRNEIPNNGIDDDQNGYVDDVQGWDVYSGDPFHPIDNHGTHVAGTVGATGNNTIGVTGVNWNVKILPVSGSSTLESIAVEAYEYVLSMRKLYNESNGEKGAYVVAANSSFGVNNGDPSQYPIWCAMFDSLGYEGVLSVGATANDDVNVDVVGDIPTACQSEFLISVTNMRSNDQLNNQAGFGQESIDLGAPGTNIFSTRAGDAYGLNSGTSMAAPHVAGAIALMYSAICQNYFNRYAGSPADLALFVKEKLLNGGVDEVSALDGITVTGGRLNLFKSVLSVSTLCPQIVFESEMSQCDSCTGTIKASLLGTSGLSSFLWSTGSTTDSISGLCAGVYYVTAIDNDGDTTIAGYALSDSGGPDLNVIKNNVSCFGGEDGEIQVSGGNDYLWNDGPSGGTRNALESGSYFVMATDSIGSCTTTVEVDIFSPQPITASYSYNLPTSDTASDGSLFVYPSGGTPPYTYLWETGDTIDSLFNKKHGKYGITITDANGCILSDSGQLGFPVGVNDIGQSADHSISIFPNPANKVVHVQSKIDRGYVRMYNAWGGMVGEFDLSYDVSIDTRKLANGVYYLTVINQENKMSTNCLIVVHE